MGRPANQSTAAAIDVTITAAAGVSPKILRRWSVSARRRLPRLRGRVSVVTVSPAVSQRLNQTYRGLDRPTNVLSFIHRSVAGPRGADATSGEIVLCPAVIRREARQHHRAYRPYFHFLLHHGFIHLLGLDHRTVAAQKRWRRYEQLLKNT